MLNQSYSARIEFEAGGLMIHSENIDNNQSCDTRETLSWLLDMLTRASKVRSEFYKHQQRFAEQSALKIVIDEAAGAIIEHAGPYCASHASLVFLLNQTIESFHGTITAANYLSRKKEDLHKVCSILLDPRNYKGEVFPYLEKGSLSSKMLSAMMAIPRIIRFEDPERSELNGIFGPCFEQFTLSARYSLSYWNMLKPSRDAYAHNYRFVFYDNSAPEKKPQFDECLLGVLPSKLNTGDISVSDFMNDKIFVGFIQRLASGKLISRLSMFERWIYLNMRNRIWNHNRPVLPEAVPFIHETKKERYKQIRDSLKYDFSIPKRRDFGKYEKKDQENLHKKFLIGLQSLGEKIAMIDQSGKTRVLQFIDEEEPAKV